MKFRFTNIAILLAAWMPFGQAGAELFNFDCLSNNDPVACQIGEEQFTLEATAIGGDPGTGGLSLMFRNTEQTSPLLIGGENPDPSITELYFDTLDGGNGLFTTVANFNPNDFLEGTFNTTQTVLNFPFPDVDFKEGSSKSLADDPNQDELVITPGNLPGGDAIGFTANWAAEAANSNAQNQATQWGINEGEFLEVQISTLPLNIFLAALDAGEFNIGMHVRAFEGGGFDSSESFVLRGVNPIPVPAAFWLFGTALIGFIGISRRTRL